LPVSRAQGVALDTAARACDTRRLARLLAPSGVLAVFWNRLSWGLLPAKAAELAAIYPAGSRRILGAGAGPGPDGSGTGEHGGAVGGLGGASSAEAPRVRSAGVPQLHLGTSRYTTDSYLELLRTHSDPTSCSTRPAAEWQAFSTRIAASPDRRFRGGAIELDLR